MRITFKGAGVKIAQCDYCLAPIITVVEAKAGHIELCMEHTLEFAGGKDTEWFEAHHAEFADHVTERIRKSQEHDGSQRNPGRRSHDATKEGVGP